MFSYQRLSKHQWEEGGEDEEGRVGVLVGQGGYGGVGRGSRGWLRLRRSSSSRRWWRRRPRVRVLGLSRFLGKKVRNALGKVVERFKEGRSHFGELFAGNYLFMQVNPSLSYLEKSIMAAGHGGGGFGHGLPPPSSRLFLRGVVA